MGSVAITNMRVVFGDFEVFQMWEVNDEPAIVLGMDVLGTTSAMMLDFTRKELSILPQHLRRHAAHAQARTGHAYPARLITRARTSSAIALDARLDALGGGQDVRAGARMAQRDVVAHGHQCCRTVLDLHQIWPLSSVTIHQPLVRTASFTTVAGMTCK